ncbi:hypothetical protein INR49_024633 [Caranx melampygus]|nr:hypothetical protein INR49_024633 [Caranx melampygus]
MDILMRRFFSTTLETEELRKKYISPPVPELGQPLEYPDPGQPWMEDGSTTSCTAKAPFQNTAELLALDSRVQTSHDQFR